MFWLIAQALLIAAWYTIWPFLSAWVVFLPLILWGVILTLVATLALRS